jgi:glycosyltransferase involved in cell wall biosynthesis
MKILHIIPYFAPAWRYGGPIQAAVGLTQALVQLGHEVTVMTTNIDGPSVLDVPVDQPVNMNGVHVWYFQVERPRWWFFSRSLAVALHQQVKHFDLVHMHTIFLWPTTIAAFLSRRQRRPYIIRPAGMLDPACLAKSYDSWSVSLRSRTKKWIYLQTLGMRDLQCAAALQFTSRLEMERAGHVRLRPPAFVVPLGVETPATVAEPVPFGLRAQYPELKGRKVVLFLSRLDSKKGLNLLIPALAALAEKRNDFAFVLAGSGERGYEAIVERLIKEYRLEERTILPGFVQGEVKWALLRESDVFVLPSYQENFGIAVVEAMAAGLPVVISDRVNIHYEVEQAGAGLVTSLDPKEIANAIEQLVTDDYLRQKMGQNGSLLARERFSWEKIARETVAMYETVVGSARRQL